MANSTQSQKNLEILTSDHKTYRCWWELGDTYGDGQQFQYSINGGASWTDVTVSTTQRNVNVTFTSRTFDRFTFRVRGKRSGEYQSDEWVDYEWSSWVSFSIDYKTASTSSQTNLAISTKDHKSYTCSWRLGDTYGAGQQFQYSTNGGASWKLVAISSTQTSVNVTISDTGISRFTFRVQGRRSSGWDSSASNPTWTTYEWSSWASSSVEYRTASTSSQTNLSAVTNDHKTFSCRWSLGDTYDGGQQFQYSVNGGVTWKAVGVSSSQTSASVTLTNTDNLEHFTFRVRGLRTGSWDSSGSTPTWTTYSWSSWASASIEYRDQDTTAPENVTIRTTDNRTYTCTWNIGDINYNSGQQFQYALNDSTQWKSVAVTADQTSVTVKIDMATVLTKFSIRVRGKRPNAWDSSSSSNTYTRYGWSSWSTASYDLPTTDAPSNLDVERTGTMRFVCTWTINNPLGNFYNGGQQFQYRLNGSGNWISVEVSNSKSNVVIDAVLPKTFSYLRQFSFRVRGRRAAGGGIVYEWSPWATKDMDIDKDTSDTTKAPTGLTITRNNLKFICEWKIAADDHNGGQLFEYRINDRPEWISAVVAKTQTAKTISLDASDFYPNTKADGSSKPGLIAFSFRVQGKQAQKIDNNLKKTTYKWSGWKTYRMNLYRPRMPSLTSELDSNADKTTKFSWEVETAEDDLCPFTRVKYQSILVKNSNVTDGSTLSWSTSNSGWITNTAGASGYRNINESFDTTPSGTDIYGPSYTRWFRVMSQGPYGVSSTNGTPSAKTSWRYSKHVYAKPYGGLIESAKAGAANNVTTVSAKWKVSQPASRPIDKTELQYVITNPEAGMKCPDGASWNTAATIRDTTGIDSAVFRVEEVLDATNNLDQCMWVRIKNTHDHDNNWSASAPYRVKNGKLTPPSITSVQANKSTSSITIQVSNESQQRVPDSKVAVLCKCGDAATYVCGILSDSDEHNIKIKPWDDASTLKIGIYAFQGTYKRTESKVAYQYSYAITANMTSTTVWDGGTVPAEPKNVTARISNPGEVLVSWSSTWLLVNKTEVSWSKNEFAWESTEEPSTYTVGSAETNKIRIPNLEVGTTWYFRVRFIKEVADTTVYGPYCDTVQVSLTSAPAKPVLLLSDSVISTKKSLKVSWTYESEDNTKQARYEIRTASVNDTTDEVTPLALLYSETTASTARTFYRYTAGYSLSRLDLDTINYLIVRVYSSGGIASEWSDPVPLIITSPIVCRITQTSLQTVTITDDDGTSRNVVALTQMPLSVTATGATAGGRTSVVIERSAAYQMDRPDESVFNGYENEAIVSYTQDGEETITITKDMLVGYLDDGAQYRLVVTVQDSYGQTSSKTKAFTVKWAHQAVMPEATVEYDEDNIVTFITPVAPEGADVGDVCDIYRLSADKPELIFADAVFGTKYVDPYPTIGEYGGHRVVFKTANGDYITADNHPAWIDLGEAEGDYYHTPDIIIDFNGERAMFRYNVSLDSSWSKDFKETKYLGGSVQGDWNPGVSRTGSISSIAVTSMDPDFIRVLRRLAVYTGICHVRTPDGSSYSADVQVSESRDISKAKELVNFTLNITRVDPEGFDGMTYDQWVETVEPEIEEEETEEEVSG